MHKEIPHIVFDSPKPENSGIDILTISSLAERKDDITHNPEKAHQLAFNMIVFYTAGQSRQLVDFVWHDVKKTRLFTYLKVKLMRFNLAIAWKVTSYFLLKTI